MPSLALAALGACLLLCPRGTLGESLGTATAMSVLYDALHPWTASTPLWDAFYAAYSTTDPCTVGPAPTYGPEGVSCSGSGGIVQCVVGAAAGCS